MFSLGPNYSGPSFTTTKKKVYAEECPSCPPGFHVPQSWAQEDPHGLHLPFSGISLFEEYFCDQLIHYILNNNKQMPAVNTHPGNPT